MVRVSITPPPPTGPPLAPTPAPTPACPVVIGALHLDLVGRLADAHRPAASNPVRFEASPGGVGANVARAIAAAGLPCRLITPCGGDSASDPVLVLPGVTIDRVAIGGCEPGRYVAILDQRGELVAGYSDTRACEMASAGQLLAVLARQAATLCVLDANLSAEAIAGTVAGSRAPIAAVAVSPVKAQRLAPVATGIALLFCNRREALALTRVPDGASLETLADGLHAAGFARVVLTDGPAGLLVAEPEGRHRLAAPSVGAGGVAGVNGAGDALAGATLARLALSGTAPGTPFDAAAPSGRPSLCDAVATAGTQAARQVLLAR